MARCPPSILRCPITKGSLREMDARELSAVNGRITRGELRHFDGSPVARRIESALVTRDDEYVYPIEDDIVILLENLAIAAPEGGVHHAAGPSCGSQLRKEKKNVQDFYDEVGWTRVGEDLFADAQRFEDLRPVSRDYVHKCHLRVNRYLKRKGGFILDVASGPIQYPEYLTYSEDYDLRICVDISLLALKEAKRKLGDKGAYVLADVTNLPLRDGSIDAALSLHTIYHVPRDEQASAFLEIHRVLKPGSSAVVVYSWGTRSLLMNLFLLPARAIRACRRAPRGLERLVRRCLRGMRAARKRGGAADTSGPGFFYFAHGHRYLTRQEWGASLDTRVWRSVSVEFTKTYVHNWLCGRQILTVIYWLEEKFPYWAGRLGQYPLLVIRKPLHPL
ncbi:MAG: methyltransferase domain-containing protein [Planctomycetota bacterium]